MSVTFNKISRLLRTQGPGAVVRRSLARLRDLQRLRRALHGKPVFAEVESLLDFAFGADAALITPAQVRTEIDALLRLLKSRAPRRVLEIGTANGGSLFLWSRVAAADAQLISLDLPGGKFGDGYPRWKRPLYRGFALPGQRIELVQADSHAPSSLDAVRTMLGGAPLDFLFIDGDHSYDGVRRDFEMYAPLVRPGGLIAFHDIAAHADASCQVSRYWNEVRARHHAQEFIASPPVGWAGLGVIITA